MSSGYTAEIVSLAILKGACECVVYFFQLSIAAYQTTHYQNLVV